MPHEYFSASMALWNTVVGSLIVILMITLNSWEIHLLRKTKKKPVFEIFLLSLSVCDLLGGLFGLIMVVIDIIHTYASNIDMEYISLVSWFVWSIFKIYLGWVSI